MFFVGSYSVVLLASGVLTPQPSARVSSPAKVTHRARTAQIQSFQRLALLARELSTALRTDCVDNLPVLHGGGIANAVWETFKTIYTVFIVYQSGDDHERTEHQETDQEGLSLPQERKRPCESR